MTKGFFDPNALMKESDESAENQNPSASDKGGDALSGNTGVLPDRPAGEHEAEHLSMLEGTSVAEEAHGAVEELFLNGDEAVDSDSEAGGDSIFQADENNEASDQAGADSTAGADPFDFASTLNSQAEQLEANLNQDGSNTEFSESGNSGSFSAEYTNPLNNDAFNIQPDGDDIERTELIDTEEQSGLIQTDGLAEAAQPNTVHAADVAATGGAPETVEFSAPTESAQPAAPTKNAPASDDTGEHHVAVLQDVGAHTTAQLEMAKSMMNLVLCDRSFNSLANEILRMLMTAVDGTVGSVIELDHGKNDFFFRAAIGGSADKLNSVRIPRDKGLVGYVAESGNSLMLKDAQNDQTHLKSISLMVGFEAKSCMVVPIHIAGQLFGIVELFNKKGNGLFSHEDLETVELGCEWAAKVLETRFLFAHLTKKHG